jgi:hypothetical protein
MLIRDFVYVDRPFEQVRSGLTRSSPEWLGLLAEDAAAVGETVRLRIGPATPIPGLSKVTEVRLGPPSECGDGVSVPIVWEATGLPRAFPVFEGDIDIAPLGPQETQVTLSGRYEPPLGGVGRQIDRLILHRVAEASIREFLRRVAVAVAADDVPVAESPAAPSQRLAPATD